MDNKRQIEQSSNLDQTDLMVRTEAEKLSQRFNGKFDKERYIEQAKEVEQQGGSFLAISPNIFRIDVNDTVTSNNENIRQRKNSNDDGINIKKIPKKSLVSRVKDFGKKALKALGKTLQATGKCMKVAGKGLQKAGKTMQKAGRALLEE